MALAANRCDPAHAFGARCAVVARLAAGRVLWQSRPHAQAIAAARGRLPAPGAGAGGAAYDRARRPRERDGDVVAHDARIRAAARGLRGQQPQLLVRGARRDEGVRARDPDRGNRAPRDRVRQRARSPRRQVRHGGAHPGAGVARARAAGGRVLRQLRVRRRRHAHGAQVRLLRRRGRAGVGRAARARPAHDPPPRPRRVHVRRRAPAPAVEGQVWCQSRCARVPVRVPARRTRREVRPRSPANGTHPRCRSMSRLDGQPATRSERAPAAGVGVADTGKHEDWDA